MKPLKRIAVTGGIAEGKSTVVNLLAQHGFSVDSADEMAKAVFGLPAVQTKLAALMGSDSVDRNRMRLLLSLDHEFRRQVNFIMHPYVVERLDQSAAVVVEVPLLLESCLHTEFDQVWVVACGRTEQQRRLAERYGPNGADSMLLTQVSSEMRVAFADVIIRTDNGLEETERQLKKEVNKWLPPLAES